MFYANLKIGATDCTGEGYDLLQAGQNAIAEAEKLVTFKSDAQVSIIFQTDEGDIWAETWTLNCTK